MTTFYEVLANKTSKAAGSKGGFSQYDKTRETFATIKDAKDYIKTTYGGHKKVKMYRDGKDGEPQHIGYIYSWTEKGSVQGDYNTYYMQDWVEVREIKATTIIR